VELKQSHYVITVQILEMKFLRVQFIPSQCFITISQTRNGTERSRR